MPKRQTVLLPPDVASDYLKLASYGGQLVGGAAYMDGAKYALIRPLVKKLPHTIWMKGGEDGGIRLTTDNLKQIGQLYDTLMENPAFEDDRQGAGFFGDVFRGIKNVGKSLIKRVGSIAKPVLNTLKPVVKEALNLTKPIAKTALEGVKQVGKQALNEVVDGGIISKALLTTGNPTAAAVASLAGLGRGGSQVGGMEVGGMEHGGMEHGGRKMVSAVMPRRRI